MFLLGCHSRAKTLRYKTRKATKTPELKTIYDSEYVNSTLGMCIVPICIEKYKIATYNSSIGSCMIDKVVMFSLGKA